MSFPEIFGQLHIKANHGSSTSSSPFPISSPTSFSLISSTVTTDMYTPHTGDFPNADKNEISIMQREKNSGSGNYEGLHTGRTSSMNSETLSTCLGVENSVNAADLSKGDFCKNDQWQKRKGFRRNTQRENPCDPCIKSGCREGFPPPISSIGSSGKPWVLYKSYKENGRFILKEIKVPTQEFMHARRENGCLKLTFIQSESDDEFFADDEDDEDDDSAY